MCVSTGFVSVCVHGVFICVRCVFKGCVYGVYACMSKVCEFACTGYVCTVCVSTVCVCVCVCVCV